MFYVRFFPVKSRQKVTKRRPKKPALYHFLFDKFGFNRTLFVYFISFNMGKGRKGRNTAKTGGTSAHLAKQMSQKQKGKGLLVLLVFLRFAFYAITFLFLSPL